MSQILIPKSVNESRRKKQEERPPDLTIREVHPRDDLLLVEMAPLPDKSSGGIILTESTRDQGTAALVLEVGQGRWSEDGTRRLPHVCQVGDIVLISRQVGRKIELVPGKELFFIREDDVLATAGRIEPTKKS